MKLRKTNNIASFLKGIGIISVVLGHTVLNLVNFTYSYHLMLFFFVSGFLYNEKKYNGNVKLLFLNRLFSILGRYLQISIVLLLLTPVFLNMGIYTNGLDVRQFFYNICSLPFFMYIVPITPAAWYIPVSIFACVIFGHVCNISYLLQQVTKNRIKSYYLIILISIIAGVLGLLLESKSFYVIYRIDVAILACPFLAMGFLYSKCLDKIKSVYLSIFSLLLFPILYMYFIDKYKMNIDLSMGQVVDPVLFFPLTFCGVLFWVGIECAFFKTFAHKLVSFVGNYSLEIMLLHFVPIKILDYIFVKFVDRYEKYDSYNNICMRIPNLALLYNILGIFMPIMVGVLLDCVKEIINVGWRQKYVKE